MWGLWAPGGPVGTGCGPWPFLPYMLTLCMGENARKPRRPSVWGGLLGRRAATLIQQVPAEPPIRRDAVSFLQLGELLAPGQVQGPRGHQGNMAA